MYISHYKSAWSLLMHSCMSNGYYSNSIIWWHAYQMVLLNSIQYNSLMAGVMWNRHNITVSILDSNLFAPNNTYNNYNTSFIYATCTVSWSKWDELLFITFMHFDIICLFLWPTHFSYMKMYVKYQDYDCMRILRYDDNHDRCPVFQKMPSALYTIMSSHGNIFHIFRPL